MENHGVDTTRGLIFINPHTELFRKIEQSAGCGEVKYVVEDVRVKISDLSLPNASLKAATTSAE